MNVICCYIQKYKIKDEIYKRQVTESDGSIAEYYNIALDSSVLSDLSLLLRSMQSSTVLEKMLNDHTRDTA